MTMRQVEEMALKLDPNERERLATRLLASVGTSQLTDIDQAWIDEAESRLDEILNGSVKGIPGDEFVDLVKKDLGWN